MIDTYTIFSPGRTGSHIILEMIAGTPFTKGGLADAYGLWLPLNEKEYQQYINHENVVIHLHDIELIKNLDPATVTLIISLRKNLFEQAMSLIVARIVNEWSGKDYSNKSVDPVTFNETKFIHILKMLLTWQNNLDLSGYKKVITIYYEDLVEQGEEFLAKELNLKYDRTLVGKVNQKSPYFYKDIIINWATLYQKFLDLHISHK